MILSHIRSDAVSALLINQAFKHLAFQRKIVRTYSVRLHMRSDEKQYKLHDLQVMF